MKTKTDKRFANAAMVIDRLAYLALVEPTSSPPSVPLAAIRRAPGTRPASSTGSSPSPASTLTRSRSRWSTTSFA